MSDQLFKITIGEETRLFAEGTPYGEVLQQWNSPESLEALLVLVNGTLCELHKAVREDCTIKLIAPTSNIGRDTYCRSLNFLFLKALHDIVGASTEIHAKLNFANGNGYFYTIQGMEELPSDLAERIKTRMQELVDAKRFINKNKVKKSYAQKLFASVGMQDKADLFKYRRVSQVNIYSLDDYNDYFYGYMAWHTGFLKYFDVTMYEHGIVLVMPDASDGKTMRPFTPFPKIFRIQNMSEGWGTRQGINTVADLNRVITDNQFGQQLLVTEALQEGRISAIADEIAAREGVKFVLIAGPSSSGKTTFSRRLSIQLSAKGMIPHAISLDDFYRDRAHCPRDEEGNLDFEALEALDVDLIQKCFRELQEGKAVELPRFNFLTGQPEYKGDILQLGEEDITVIEGIHGLNPELIKTLPQESIFRIYISNLTTLDVDQHNYISTTDARLLRRIVRDYYHRGTSACETIERWPSVRAGEQKYIFTNQENAEEMFNSSLLYEFAILKVYAEPLLFQVPEDRPEYLEAKRLLKFLDYFLSYPSEDVPNNSILREFIGGSCFDV